jgi:hypothetical protein
LSHNDRHGMSGVGKADKMRKAVARRYLWYAGFFSRSQ